MIGSITSTYSGLNVFNGYGDDSTLERIQYTQIGDILFLVHPDHEPMAIKRDQFGSFGITLAVDAVPRPSGDGPWNGQAYRAVNISAITVTLSSLSVGPGVTLTSSAALFNSDMVDSWWKISSTGIGYFYITQYNSTTSVTGYLAVAPGSVGPTTAWYEGAWSNYRGWPRAIAYSDGRLIYGGTAHQPDTMWFSELGDIRDFNSPLSGIVNSDPFDATIASSAQVNQIQWVSKGKTLQIGTLGSEYIVVAKDEALAVGPLNEPVFQADTNHGSEHVQPARYEGALAFIQRGGLKILELSFDFNEDSFRTDNLTLLADHVIKDRLSTEAVFGSGQKFLNLQYADSSDTLWMIDISYGLFGITRDRSNEVTAWHTHDIGGQLVLGANTYKPRVMSIAVAPEEGDQLWMVVQRTIDGNTVYYIETMVDEFIAPFINSNDQFSQRLNPHFSDSSLALFNGGAIIVESSNINTGTDVLTINRNHYSNIFNGTRVRYDGSSITDIPDLTVGDYYYIINSTVSFDYNFSTLTSGTIQLSLTEGGGAIDITGAGTGSHIFALDDESAVFGRLDHLEGQSVVAVADGFYVGSYTVTDGKITLPSEYAVAVIGLNYNTDIETLPVDAGATLGTAQGQTKRIDKVIFRFYRTIGCKHGRSTQRLESILFRENNLPMNVPTPMYTGDKILEMNGDWDRLGVLYIRQDIPLPMTVSSLVLRGVTNDG